MASCSRKPNVAQIKQLAAAYDGVKTAQKILAIKNKRHGWFQQARLMGKMLSDRTYQLAPGTYMTFAGALAYLAIPMDAVADMIPIAGLLDDAAVLKLVFNSAKEEVGRYLHHQEKVAA